MSEFKLKQTAEEVQKAIDDASTPSDWNQTDSSAADFIKNKPFGDMPTGGDTLYWDGNTEGLEYIDVDGNGSFLFVRLCDTVVTKEDVANGYSFMVHIDEIVTDTVDGETAQSAFQDNGYGLLADAALVFPYDGFDLDGIIIAKAGVYTVVSEGRGVPFSITIPGYTGFPGTKKMEEKYLPGAVMLYVDDENYLYATEDTSDTSKRMTEAALLKMIQSGRVFYVLVDGYIYCPATSIIMAPAFGGIVCAIGEEISQYFTAEYTAS